MKKNRARKSDATLWAEFAASVDKRDRKLTDFAKGRGRLVDDPKYQMEVLQAAIAEQIARAMKAEGIETLSELGSRLGVSRQYVSRIQKQVEQANYTLETIARLATALNCEVSVRFRHRSSSAERENEASTASLPTRGLKHSDSSYSAAQSMSYPRFEAARAKLEAERYEKAYSQSVAAVPITPDEQELAA